MRSLSLLQGIFPTQGSIPGLPHCRQILYQLSHRGSPRILEKVADPFSSGSSQPRNQTRVSCIAGGLFTNWAIVWEERWFQVSIHLSPDTEFIFFFLYGENMLYSWFSWLGLAIYFLKYIFIYLLWVNFYWSLVALQYCVSFSCIIKWILMHITYIIRIHTSPLFWISPQSRSLRSPESSSVCYTANSHQLSILYIVVILCMCHYQFPNSSHPCFPLGIHMFVFYLCRHRL